MSGMDMSNSTTSGLCSRALTDGIGSIRSFADDLNVTF
jgi:hypothetical protein